MNSKQQFFSNSEPELPTCCHNSPGVFRHRKTGVRVRSKCNTWGCDYCGPIKVNRLLDDVAYGGAVIQDRGFRWRFMTLTSSPRTNARQAFPRFRAILHKWRKKQGHKQAIQFFKVTEFTESGLRHFHLLIDTFVPFGVIQAAWRAATDGTAYWVNIKKAQVKQAAGYMAKYMTKQTVFSDKFDDGEHRYSFSQQFPRLPRPEPTGEWEFRLNPKTTSLIQTARVELAARADHRKSWRDTWSEATGRPPGRRTYDTSARVW